MNKLIIHIIFIFFLFLTKAQENLVPNGSFEEYNWCPNSIDGFYINACKHWTSPTLGSPDYFNSCSTEFDSFLQSHMYSVPENYYGHQSAHSGNAYGAFVFGQNEIGGATYSEYIQVKLEQQLIADRFYKVHFYIHNPRTSCCINSVGALFTKSELNLNNDEIISLSPQVISNPNVFFCDTNNWQEVSGIFSASGDEEYLTIGIFKKTPELQAIDYQGASITDFFSVYLYIDDISVSELGLELVNIFTPNGDGINDECFMDLKVLGAKKAEIYNRWGNVIAKGETSIFWDGTTDGKNCPEGVYFLRIEFENNSISGFIHLVR